MDESPGITRSIIPSYQNTTAASTTSALSAKFSKTTQTTSQQKEATASEAKSTIPSSSNMMLSDDQIRSEGIDMPNTHETPEEALANLVNSEPMTQDSHTDKRLRDLVNRFGRVDGLEKQLELASRRILNKKSRLNSHRAQPGTSHQSASTLPSQFTSTYSTSTPYGIDLNPVPTLDQFLTNSAPWWNAITIRLQHRWSMLVNSIAYATREQTLVME